MAQDVKRIFFDEGHQMLTDTGYRAKWSRVYELATCPRWQRIYLTATLPPVLADTWSHMAGIDFANTSFIRTTTNRPEHSYHVLHINPRERQPKSVLSKLIDKLNILNTAPDGRRIIFVTSVAECDTLSRLLGCFRHHSTMDNDSRQNNLEGWKSGAMITNSGGSYPMTWIVATPGLITGYDYPSVDTVIFWERGYGFFNVVQGAGRGGRDGRPCSVILITSDTHYTAHHRIALDQDYELMHPLDSWVNNNYECRRSIMSVTMDDISITCADIVGGNKCDICDPDTPVTRIIAESIAEANPSTIVIVPMEDVQPRSLQNITVSNSSSREWDDSMEDLECDLDDLIATVDLTPLTQLPSTALPPATAPPPPLLAFKFPSVSAISSPVSSLAIDLSSPTLSTPIMSIARPQPKTHIPAASVSGVSNLKPISAYRPAITHQRSSTVGNPITMGKQIGMSVQIGASVNVNNRNMKIEKSGRISDMGNSLRDRCLVCWTCKGIIVQVGQDHQPFKHCEGKDYCGSKLNKASVGVGQFQRLIQLAKYQFCFSCGMPQNHNHSPFKPSCHPEYKHGPCIFKGMIPTILFVMHQCGPVWEKVKKEFSLGDDMDDINNFGSWCAAFTPNSSNYYMGLEMVIWLWRERQS